MTAVAMPSAADTTLGDGTFGSACRRIGRRSGVPTGREASTNSRSRMAGTFRCPRARTVRSAASPGRQEYARSGVDAVMEAARRFGWVNDENARVVGISPSELAARFAPPWTSLHVGRIEGGTAHDITALDCRFVVTFRVVPGEDAEAWARRFEERVAEVEADMRKVRPEASITLDRYFDMPGLQPEEDGAAEELVRRLTGDNGRHVVSYGTEAGHFQRRGYSSIICGPGDIAQAHQPDEYLAVERLRRGEEFMERLVARLAA